MHKPYIGDQFQAFRIGDGHLVIGRKMTAVDPFVISPCNMSDIEIVRIIPAAGDIYRNTAKLPGKIGRRISRVNADTKKG